MGFWGFGICESDQDLDALPDIFDSESGKPLKEDVIRSRLEVWEQKRLQTKSGEARNGTKDGSEQAEQKPSEEELEEYWEFDVGLDSPRFPRLVRDYLDSGVLANLIKKYSPKRANGKWTGDHKKLVLIAYCAMELGCTLPPGFRARLKSNYHRVERLCAEMEGGMDGDLEEHTRRPHPQPPGLEPLPSQETAAATAQPARKRRKTESEATPTRPVEEYHLQFPPDTCANCGATRGHGCPDLKRCKGCKNTLYCFEGCQNWNWTWHQGHCAVDRKAEKSAEGKSTGEGGDDLKAAVEKPTA